MIVRWEAADGRGESRWLWTAASTVSDVCVLCFIAKRLVYEMYVKQNVRLWLIVCFFNRILQSLIFWKLPKLSGTVVKVKVFVMALVVSITKIINCCLCI